MDAQVAIPDWLAATFGSALVAFSFVIYARLARRLFATGGKVGTEKIIPRDMGLASTLTALLVLLGTLAFTQPEREIHITDIFNGSLHFVFLVALIGGFLLYRRVNLTEFFGLRRVGFFKSIGLGAGLLFAAYPLILALSAITQKLLGQKAEPQELVKFFVGIAHAGNEPKIAVVLVFAVLFGPACEELIFRGYIYAVFKRYLGMWPAIFVSAALFAYIHANLASLPALFLLATCLALAYETSGSLAVPYVMHATFNFLSLGALLYATFLPAK